MASKMGAGGGRGRVFAMKSLEVDRLKVYVREI